MTLKIRSEAVSPEEAIVVLVKAHGRNAVAAVESLTNSSGGTAGAGITDADVAMVNAADVSTSLAQKAATETALGTVKNALLELFYKANAYATILGLDNVTYSGGGTAADGTIDAVTVAVTAAATGAQATESNANITAINNAFYNLGALTNSLAKALGYTPLTLPTGHTYATTVSTLAVDVGTAADPGITKVAMDATLATLRDNVKTVATLLNTFNDGAGNALVVLV